MSKPLLALLIMGVLLGGALAGRSTGRSPNAPELTGGGKWLNTPGEQPLTLAALRGKVVLVEFWTAG